MSIGFKKIAQLVKDEADSVGEFSSDQRERLIELCNKIYMMESSVESISRQRMIEDIMGVIGNAADTIIKKKSK